MLVQRDIPAVLDRDIDAAAGLAALRQAARLETLDQRAASARFERVFVDLDEIRLGSGRFCRHVAVKYMGCPEAATVTPASCRHASTRGVYSAMKAARGLRFCWQL